MINTLQSIVPATVPTIVPVIAAILTGIIGPLIMYYIRKIDEKKEKLRKQQSIPYSSEDRISRLEGKWKCFFEQDLVGEHTRVEAIVKLKMEERVFIGEAEYVFNNQDRTCLNLYDGVFDGRVFKINYKNRETHVFQYGSIVMIMDNVGSRVDGMFVGYSPLLGSIVHGKVILYEKIGA